MAPCRDRGWTRRRALAAAIRQHRAGEFVASGPGRRRPVRFLVHDPAQMQVGWYLVMGWDHERRAYRVWLFDERGTQHHAWPINYRALDADGPLNGSDVPHAVLAMPDASLILNFDEGDVMARIDHCGEPIGSGRASSITPSIETPTAPSGHGWLAALPTPITIRCSDLTRRRARRSKRLGLLRTSSSGMSGPRSSWAPEPTSRSGISTARPKIGGRRSLPSQRHRGAQRCRRRRVSRFRRRRPAHQLAQYQPGRRSRSPEPPPEVVESRPLDPPAQPRLPARRMDLGLQQQHRPRALGNREDPPRHPPTHQRSS